MADSTDTNKKPLLHEVIVKAIIAGFSKDDESHFEFIIPACQILQQGQISEKHKPEIVDKLITAMAGDDADEWINQGGDSEAIAVRELIAELGGTPPPYDGGHD